MGFKFGRTNPIRRLGRPTKRPRERSETLRGAARENGAERTQFSPRLGLLAGALVAASALAPASSIGARSAWAETPETEPAITVRAVHPDRLAAAVIALFEGSRAANPAEAMAAWRRATGEHDALGKTLQAVAALFNPAMVPEWRVLDGAELALATTGGAPVFRWSLLIPNDDDAITALITSLRLSGGADAPPILDPPVAVARLDEPGPALAARLPGAVVFANDRELLAAEVERFRSGEPNPAAPALFGPDDSGFAIAVHPDRFDDNERTAPGLTRFMAAARGLGLIVANGRLGLDGDRLSLALVSHFEPKGEGGAPDEAHPALDPSWLAWFPERQTAAAVSIALGSGAEFWDGLFQVADAIDRADPARADLAPLRARLNFLGLTLGVRLEADLWPQLRGASLGLLVDEGSPAQLKGAALALHAKDAQAARRIFDKVLRPLAATLGRGIPGPHDEGDDRPHEFGEVSGRRLEALVKGSTLLVGWGKGVLDLARQSAERPDDSLAALLKKEEADADDRPINRFAVVWPDRTASALDAIGPNSPLAVALAGAAPVIWRGSWDDAEAQDILQWPELRGVVSRFLEQIPQAPFETP